MGLKHKSHDNRPKYLGFFSLSYRIVRSDNGTKHIEYNKSLKHITRTKWPRLPRQPSNDCIWKREKLGTFSLFLLRLPPFEMCLRAEVTIILSVVSLSKRFWKHTHTGLSSLSWIICVWNISQNSPAVTITDHHRLLPISLIIITVSHFIFTLQSYHTVRIESLLTWPEALNNRLPTLEFSPDYFSR